MLPDSPTYARSDGGGHSRAEGERDDGTPSACCDWTGSQQREEAPEDISRRPVQLPCVVGLYEVMGRHSASPATGQVVRWRGSCCWSLVGLLRRERPPDSSPLILSTPRGWFWTVTSRQCWHYGTFGLVAMKNPRKGRKGRVVKKMLKLCPS